MIMLVTNIYFVKQNYPQGALVPEAQRVWMNLGLRTLQHRGRDQGSLELPGQADPEPGSYEPRYALFFHCHSFERENNGKMGQFVIEPGNEEGMSRADH